MCGSFGFVELAQYFWAFRCHHREYGILYDMGNPAWRERKTSGKIAVREGNQGDSRSRRSGLPKTNLAHPTRKFSYYLAALVSITTFLVYLSSLKNGFVHWDDNHYVLDNQHIHSLNCALFRWAFSTFYFSNWHPLTWISHAMDYAVWGPNPLGHHLTNNILHAANSFIVVVLTIKLLTIYKERLVRNGSSTFIAGSEMLIVSGVTGFFFGLHPVHVESVAWIAERKDLLCAFFFLLSIMAYAKYVIFVERETVENNPISRFFIKWYLITVVFFLLALLSKPMAISLPIVLLIMDWGLFKRIDSPGTFWHACTEKIPLIALSLLSSIVTILAQGSGNAIQPLNFAPLTTRVLVADRSLMAYLGKMILPLGLIPYYPYPPDASFLSLKYFLPTALVIGITAVCLIIAKRRKLWLSVWAYYVVTLIPVLGIVQVGQQSMADRYTYLPSLGPFFAVGLGTAWVWGKLNRLSRWRRAVKLAYIGVGFLALVSLSYLTLKQIAVWKNCNVFWSYVIKKEPGRIPVAYSNKCACLSEAGQFEPAIENCTMAIAVDPSYFLAYNNRGNIFLKNGIVDRAIEDFDKAIDLDPSFADAYNNRGIAFGKLGRFDEAIANYDKAIALNPQFSLAYYNRGLIHFRTHHNKLAISDFRKACDGGLDVGCKALRDLRSIETD
jgi:hypothetical protein